MANQLDRRSRSASRRKMRELVVGSPERFLRSIGKRGKHMPYGYPVKIHVIEISAIAECCIR